MLTCARSDDSYNNGRQPAFKAYTNAATGAISHLCCEAGEPNGPLWCARTFFILNTSTSSTSTTGNGDDADGSGGGAGVVNGNAAGFADAYKLLAEVGHAAVNSYVDYGESGGSGTPTFLNPAACVAAAADSFWTKAKARGLALAPDGAESAGCTFTCMLEARDVAGKPAELVAGAVRSNSPSSTSLLFFGWPTRERALLAVPSPVSTRGGKTHPARVLSPVSGKLHSADLC